MSISSISTGAVTPQTLQGNATQRPGNSTSTSSPERVKHAHGHHHAAEAASSDSTDSTTSATGSTATAASGTASTFSLAGAALGSLINTSA
ncbi:hypothetical protein BLA18112_07266 [Burkholderia lata]|uniref:Uncharacterized protein n=1 Tax=Burkholderia lata (strain ATCC 17760 / DSM 23089 / LMG 22485 / NCIMB 9086 / R18194 / 383) TaxID=482957 RepID=A0A6P3AMG5_BURL3|nr:hypothetical protein [Burkholderia lata]VWD48090.1 hypothetical protein BLA18112_07266 [Burkholderia lata]